jgi:hypothetical protein
MRVHDSERRCVLSGEHGPRHGLIRLALGPDGQVAPDLGAKAGGRGAWLAVDRAALDAAVARGRLAGALRRAFRAEAVAVPADLGARIEAGLVARALDRLGIETRAGGTVTGAERVEAAIRGGAIGLLVSAADAGEDGLRALRAALRHAAPDAQALTLPADREALSRALGRANTVHVAVRAGAPSDRVGADIARWRGFLGLDGRAAETAGSPASPHGTQALRSE